MTYTLETLYRINRNLAQHQTTNRHRKILAGEHGVTIGSSQLLYFSQKLLETTPELK